MFIVGKSFFCETLSKLDIKSRGYLKTPFKSPLSYEGVSDNFTYLAQSHVDKLLRSKGSRWTKLLPSLHYKDCSTLSKKNGALDPLNQPDQPGSGEVGLESRLDPVLSTYQPGYFGGHIEF